MNEIYFRYATAKSYIEAIKMIITSKYYDNQPGNISTLPTHMLAGFGLELYIKSWLLHSGISSKDVKKFNHDLRQLYQEAKLYNFIEMKCIDELINILAGPHADFTYRYLKGNGEITPLR